jgi:RNA polymerase sigma-70 factor, ECF subfamily
LELTIETTSQSDLEFAQLAEQEIVSRAKVDPMALAFLYRQHYAAIYGYVVRRIGNSHDSSDIVAEVFMSMVRYLPRFRWTGAPFRCWLLVLTTNQINRWIRKRRFWSLWHPIESSESLAAEHLIAEQHAAPDFRIEAIRNAMLALPLSHQTTLTLYYFEELPIQTIAKIMNCRPGTVKSRLARGREQLKRRLNTQEDKNRNERRPIGSVLEKFEV